MNEVAEWKDKKATGGRKRKNKFSSQKIYFSWKQNIKNRR